ncbi:LacI family DNA-binding transcriptional regulator [Mesorhizobium sp. NBSH29]|nr:LacI family DNA-binding transcriptional regulator [Mesorhizobium sp. NBSH29]
MLHRATPTIQDVARLANVSTATVSRALATPERVAEDTRRIVMEAVELTGYRVNQTARNLRRQQAGAIVVLVPNLGNPFFSRILAGIEATASRAGLNVLIADTIQPGAEQARLGDYLHNNRADGILVLDGSLADDFFASAGRAHPPVVYACEWNEGTTLPSIRFDNAGGLRLAVEHLLALGHRHIGHVLGPWENVLTRERLRGFEAALAAHGLSPRPDWLFDGDFTLAAGARAAQQWLKMVDRPTCITAASDEIACGFISELYRNGISVPDEVSVVGFDDIDIAEHFIPALTTVHQPRMKIGEEAAAALIDLISGVNGAGRLASTTTVLDAHLEIRASTATPRVAP